MTFLAAAFVVAACLGLCWLFRLPVMTRAVLARGRATLRELRDAGLADRDKQRAVQTGALRMLLLAGGIAFTAAAAVALPLGVVALLAAAGAVEFDAVLARATSPPFLLAAAGLGLLALVLLRRRRS